MPLGTLALLTAFAAAAGEVKVTVLTRAAVPGEAMAIAVEGPVAAKPRGRLGGQSLSFYKTRAGTYAALAAFDLDVTTGTTRLELELEEDGAPHYWSTEIIVEPKNFPTKHITVDDRFVHPPKADEERADEESQRLQRLFAEETGEPLFEGRFKSPIPGAPSARFGERRIFNGVPKNPHSGADLRAGKGQPVRAPAGGRVVLTEELFYAGKTIILDHGLGLYTLYAHLSSIDVSRGERVKAGQRLGRVGATGRVTGPHLHWAAKLRGARVDPFSLTALPLDRYAP